MDNASAQDNDFEGDALEHALEDLQEVDTTDVDVDADEDEDATDGLDLVDILAQGRF